MVRGRNCHVDYGPGADVGRKCCSAGADRKVRAPEVGGCRTGGIKVKVHDAGQLHLGRLFDRVQPGAAHAAGTDDDDAQRRAVVGNSGEVRAHALAPW
ncbi:hypothetical protein D9M72_405930 [compost metagenome]